MIERLSVLRNVRKLMDLYDIKGEIVICLRNDMGHINDTYYVGIVTPYGNRRDCIFQRVNTNVFTEPMKIMHNIGAVSTHLVKKYGLESTERTEVMSYLRNRMGQNYTVLEDGGFWRVSEFVVGVCYDQIDDPKILRDTGYMFGHFQNMLSDLDTSTLEYPIPDFHNTKKRLEALEAKISEDPEDRCERAVKEIDFFLSNKDIANKLCDLEKTGVLPLRVTHNDTKYNNMLVDAISKKPICVIDLDTMMPGLTAHDYGDAIRCAANKSTEDEIDLSKVGLDRTYFEAFTEGFVTEAKNFMTPEEADSLALGALTITYELASRFLADYIDGDKYFSISRRNHNLERARCQIQLARDMMANYDYMDNTVRKFYK